MRFWWVNQNQTFRHEIAGSYLWSPKRSKDGRRNPFYEFMKAVSPGDVVFSFVDTRIPALALVVSHAYEAPKPLEFGSVGAYWDVVGWRVDARFTRLRHAIRPAEHIERLRPFLPAKYAPLQLNGNGLQAVYLTAVPDSLAWQLVDLIGREARAVVQGWAVEDPKHAPVLVGQAEWEEHQIEQVKSSSLLADTDRAALVLARRGQGLFRSRVAQFETRCRVTGVENREYLRASHTKPWRDSDNEERLNGENGFLLSPDVDLLFDRGFLTFDANGQALVSPVAERSTIARLGITDDMLRNVGPFTPGQKRFLEYHRENIFLEARVKF